MTDRSACTPKGICNIGSFDACYALWSVDFLEHIGLHKMKFYLPTFRKAVYLFVAPSYAAGWHHVEVHKDDWWIHKFELYGFKYMPELTLELREVARQEAMKGPRNCIIPCRTILCSSWMSRSAIGMRKLRLSSCSCCRNLISF